MFKEAFAVGQRVRFARSHDKVTKLFGRIVKIHEGKDDCVDIKTEPDGKLVEVSSLETAHAGDVVLAEQKSLVPNAGTDDTSELEKDAISYVMNRGYSQWAAEKIVSEVGIEAILKSRNEDRAEREAAQVADGVAQFSKPAESAPAPAATDEAAPADSEAGEVVQDPSPVADPGAQG